MTINSIIYNCVQFFNKSTDNDEDNNDKLSIALLIPLVTFIFMAIQIDLFKYCKWKTCRPVVQVIHPPLMDLSNKLEIIKVAQQILEDLYDTYEKGDTSISKEFSFSIYLPKSEINKLHDKSKVTPPLLVKFKSGTNENSLPLMAILNAIEWNKLDSKWENISSKQWRLLSKQSNYHDNSDMKKDHYLEAYTAKAYKKVNAFLRTASIRKKDIFNFLWESSRVDESIDYAARESLLTCIKVASCLKDYPSVPKGTIVHRKVNSEKAPGLMNKYVVGNIVTEESFISTQQPGGYAFISGDIEYYISTALHSKGKAIQTISINSHEKECLFPPFTSFKVEGVKFLERSTGKPVDIKTYKDPKQLLNTKIRKIVILSEIAS